MDGLFGLSTGRGSTATSAFLEQRIAAGSTSLDFTNCFSSAYDVYQIQIMGFKPVTNGAAPLLRFSTNGGSTYDTSSIYDWGNGVSLLGSASTGGNAQGSVDGISIFSDSSRVGLLSSALPALAATFQIYNPLDTTDYKIVSGYGMGAYSANSGRYSFHFAGLYKNTAAVSAFRIIMSSGNISAGTVRCYGIPR